MSTTPFFSYFHFTETSYIVKFKTNLDRFITKKDKLNNINLKNHTKQMILLSNLLKIHAKIQCVIGNITLEKRIKYMIKIIFFDIDGTLLDYGAKQISPSVVEALNLIQKKGIKLFLATGRPCFVIPEFSGIQFDGALSFNGAYTFDQKDIIYKNPLNKKEITRLQENAKRLNKSIAYATTDEIVCDSYQEELDRYFRIANQKCPVKDNWKDILNKEIYQIMIATQQSEDAELMKGIQDLKTVRWIDFATDIIPKNGGKEKAMQKVLDHYGISKSESMAFGDGGNDAEMIAYAHIGVAMGNAMPAVKKVANYVAKDVSDDGIIDGLKYFKVL